MSDGIEPEVIKKTQQLLGKHVKQPPLTEKLLSKPPFRFIHDIVVAVITNTGFLKGLYTNEELSVENVRERDAKLAFLNKLIVAVQRITKKDLKVKASRIIAGLQVKETNLLLQAIAYGIDNKLDFSEFEKKEKKKKNEQANKPINKTVRKDKTNQSSKENTPKEHKVQKSTTKESKTPRTNNHKDRSGSKKIESKAKNYDKNVKLDDVDSPKSISKSTTLIVEEANSEELVFEANETKTDGQVEEERPKTRDIQNGYLAKMEKNEQDINVQKNSIENKNENEISLVDLNQNTNKNVRRHSARPKSARPKSGEFRGEIEDNTVNEVTVEEPDTDENLVLEINRTERPKSSLRPPSVRPSSARPGAPRLRPDSALPIHEVVSMGKINVIVENFDIDATDEESVVIQNVSEETLETDTAIDLPTENQSHLVEQIMDQIKDSDEIGKPMSENDWDQDNPRGKDITNKEMDDLRNLIQSLTRSANPLGKLLNYLHEDIETMVSELQQWSKTKNQLYAEMIKKEKIKSEADRPLHGKLENLNIEIARIEEEISDVRRNILKNDIRINKILSK